MSNPIVTFEMENGKTARSVEISEDEQEYN